MTTKKYVKQILNPAFPVIGLFLISLLSCMSIGLWLCNHKVLTGHNYSEEIEKIIQDAQGLNVLDLTQFKTGDWDEIAVWSPYSDVRDLKIDGIYLVFEMSNLNIDDANNVLLFIKNNKIKGYAVFHRKKVDFTKMNIGVQRILRGNAIFEFEHINNFSSPKTIKK